jgi:hypothetical protein
MIFFLPTPAIAASFMVSLLIQINTPSIAPAILSKATELAFLNPFAILFEQLATRGILYGIQVVY